MKSLILRILIMALSLFLVAMIVPGIEITDFWAALIAAIVLGLLNVTIKPIAKLLTLPLTVLTLGLFAFVLNGLFLMLAAYLVSGLSVSGIFAAIIGSILMSIISSLAYKLIS